MSEFRIQCLHISKRNTVVETQEFILVYSFIFNIYLKVMKYLYKTEQLHEQWLVFQNEVVSRKKPENMAVKGRAGEANVKPSAS